MVLNAGAGKPLPVYGDGMNVRDWIHVSDHSRGAWAALTKGKAGEVYNLGSDNEWPNLEIVRLILKHLGKPESLIKFVKDRPGHDLRYAIDASKAKKELGWKALVAFDGGLRETIDWYMANEAWLASVQSGEYRHFFERWYKER
jgi:dTDP-glucose 4,6-dehydratase